MPSSSNQGKGRKDSLPLRSTGRTFASIDPERVREVVPSAQQQQEQPAADEAGHRSVGAVRVRQVNQGGSEGGGGRR